MRVRGIKKDFWDKLPMKERVAVTTNLAWVASIATLIFLLAVVVF